MLFGVGPNGIGQQCLKKSFTGGGRSLLERGNDAFNHRINAVARSLRRIGKARLIYAKQELRPYCAAGQRTKCSIAHQDHGFRFGGKHAPHGAVTAQRVSDQGVVIHLAIIILPEAAQLISETLSVSALGGTRLALDLMEADAFALLGGWLNDIRSREGIGYRVNVFLIEAPRFRSTDVAPHFTEDFLVQVTHKALDNHKGLMGDRRVDGRLEAPSMQQCLACRENIGGPERLRDFGHVRYRWQCEEKS